MSDSKRYSTLVNNTILFAISNFGSKIISLIIQPYLSYALASPDVMGVTSLMQSVANLLIPVVSLGVSFAVIRFGLDRKVDKSSVFMNGLATILLGFALMAVCWPLVRLIPNAADYLVLIYACVLMSCLRTLCTQFIRSRMLNRLVAVDGVLTSATLLGFYYLFLDVLDLGANGYLLATACSDALSAIFVFIAGHCHQYFSFKKFNKALWKDMLRYCIPMIPASISFWIINASDLFYVQGMCDGIDGKSKSFIINMGLLLLALAAVGLLCSVTAQFFAAKAAIGFCTDLRAALLKKIQSFSYAVLDTLGVSGLITRMTSDINQIQTGVNLSLRLLLRSPFVVFGAMIMAFTIDTRCALIFAGVIVLLCAVVFSIMLASIPKYRKVQAELDGVTGTVRENLVGVRVLRAFCREEEQIRTFDRRSERLLGLQINAGKLSALLNPLTYVIVNLAIVAILRTGAVRVDSGALTQGQVIALYNYMSQILVELIKFANLILNITKSVACAGRISQVLETKSSMADGQDALPDGSGSPALQFCEVSFRYPGAGADALSDISFSAAPGQTIGVIGGTGAGKSTLANLIPRFYDVTGGRILLDGQELLHADRSVLREIQGAEIGVVFQEPQSCMDPLMKIGPQVEETLRIHTQMPKEERHQRAMAAMAAAELPDPEGICDKYPHELSGGMLQRAMIAAAIVNRPKLLLLDEPTTALDVTIQAQILEMLKKLNRESGVSMLFISHNLNVVRKLCRRVAVMQRGVLVEEGDTDQVFYHPQHPYTQKLIDAIPTRNRKEERP